MNESIVVRQPQDLIPDTKNMEILAEHLLASGLFRSAQNMAGVISIIEYGRELGIPPVAALQTMAIVKGRLCMEAKAMLAVAHNRASVTWKIITLDDIECKITFIRPDFENAVVSFTYKEAKDAGLTDKDNWKLYRQDMLFARAASRGIRRIAPDAVLGLYSTEEMRDVEAIEKKGIRVPDDSEIIIEKAPGSPAKGRSQVPPARDKEEDFPVAPEPEDLDEPFVGDDGESFPPPSKDAPALELGERVPDPAFAEPGELTEDVVLNSYIGQIHAGTERAGIDEVKFKEWLVGQGAKMNRKFVGRIGKVLRYHQGKPEDVKYLQDVLEKAISMYAREVK